MLTPSGRSAADGAEAEMLPNDLLLIVSEDHTFGVVSVAFSVPMGSRMCPSGKAGMADLAAATMTYGPEGMGYTEFNGRLADDDSYIAFGAHDHDAT